MNKLALLLCLSFLALTQSVSQKEVVRCANDQIGKPYSSGGVGPDEFDCSGLAYYCHGKAIPRVSSAQASGSGQSIAYKDVQPGDLMFWDTEGKGSVTHTTICIGGGEMIHAPKPNDKVKKATYLNNSYW